MQGLRILATSFLASACVLTAAAQAPAASLTTGTLHPTLNPQTLSTPQTFITSSLTSTFTVETPQSDSNTFKPYSFHFEIPKGASTLAFHADTKPLDMQVQTLVRLKAREAAILAQDNFPQSNAPCYKLRSYGFTPQDLKSPHPHASTETDCTPAASAHLKVLQLPAAVNAK